MQAQQFDRYELGFTSEISDRLSGFRSFSLDRAKDDRESRVEYSREVLVRLKQEVEVRG